MLRKSRAGKTRLVALPNRGARAPRLLQRRGGGGSGNGGEGPRPGGSERGKGGGPGPGGGVKGEGRPNETTARTATRSEDEWHVCPGTRTGITLIWSCGAFSALWGVGAVIFFLWVLFCFPASAFPFSCGEATPPRDPRRPQMMPGRRKRKIDENRTAAEPPPGGDWADFSNHTKLPDCL